MLPQVVYRLTGYYLSYAELPPPLVSDTSVDVRHGCVVRADGADGVGLVGMRLVGCLFGVWTVTGLELYRSCSRY